MLNGFKKTPVLIPLAPLRSTGHDWLNIKCVAPKEDQAGWMDDDLFSNLSLPLLDWSAVSSSVWLLNESRPLSAHETDRAKKQYCQ